MVSETGKRDARTLKVDATPSDAWTALAQFVRDCGAPPDTQWAGLDVAVRGSITRMRDLGREIEHLARGMGDHVHVERASVGLICHEVAGLVACRMSIDLNRSGQLHGQEARARLTQLLLALSRLEGYRVRARLGRRPCSLDDAIRAISEEREVDPRRRDGDARSGESARRRAAAGASAGGAAPRGSAAGAGPRGSAAGAGRDPRRSAPRASGTRAQTRPIDLFLRKTGLRSPYTAQELKKAFRVNAAALHPDHRPDEPGANEEFRLFMQGYEQLLAQVRA